MGIPNVCMGQPASSNHWSTPSVPCVRPTYSSPKVQTMKKIVVKRFTQQVGYYKCGLTCLVIGSFYWSKPVPVSNRVQSDWDWLLIKQ